MMKRMMIVAGTGLALLSSISLAEAKDCKPLYTAEGPLTQPSQWDAERSAKHYWKGHVAKLYGSKYADWDKAELKKIECREIAEYFQCWAEAEPCR